MLWRMTSFRAKHTHTQVGAAFHRYGAAARCKDIFSTVTAILKLPDVVISVFSLLPQAGGRGRH